MGDYGVKISLPSYDVKTANLQQTAFSSKYPIFKIAFSGSLNLTVGPGSGSAYSNFNITFTHDLGYIPAFYCYSSADDISKRQMLDFSSSFGGFFGHHVPIYARMTTTQLMINGDVYDNVSKQITIHYFIFVDSGE